MRVNDTSAGTAPERREATFEKMVYGGDALARGESGVVLAPFVLPGERALIDITRTKNGLLHGFPVELLHRSEHRIQPPCPYFTRCGGCDYQHAPYEYQIELKRGILLETLRRIGKFEPPEEVAVVAGEPWNYRNRSQFHFDRGRIGYLEAGSHRLCAIEECPISSPKLNETIAVLRGMLRDPKWPGFLKSLEVFTDERQVQVNVRDTDRHIARHFFDWCASLIPGYVAGPIEYEAAGFRFRVSGQSFFQVNRFLIDSLVAAALEGAEGEAAVDLYAGVGLFSLPLKSRFARVTAVESGGSAVRDLAFNAERAGLEVAAGQAQAEDYLERLDAAPDFVIADPPRSGLGKRAARRLAELRPRRLHIVACDPATLARDLALLLPHYEIERLTLIDLFPQTYHLETVAALRSR